MPLKDRTTQTHPAVEGFSAPIERLVHCALTGIVFAEVGQPTLGETGLNVHGSGDRFGVQCLPSLGVDELASLA